MRNHQRELIIFNETSTHKNYYYNEHLFENTHADASFYKDLYEV